MKIIITSVSISDYDKALKFYTDVLGFVKKENVPLGGWSAVAYGCLAGRSERPGASPGTKR